MHTFALSQLFASDSIGIARFIANLLRSSCNIL